ncbi:MAG: site-specific integrase [Solirubrobacteraceae bacterium]|nr:site-specific integrase [Solirubrobacteraceae bacterium]
MAAPRITGNVRVEERKNGRVWVAAYIQATGTKTRKTLGPAWVRDTGKRTDRGAIDWRAASGSKPDGTYLTPRDAEDALEALLHAERQKPSVRRRGRARTWGDASDSWIERAETVRGVAPTTLRNYRSVLAAFERDGLPRGLPLAQIDAGKIEQVQADMLARDDPKLPRRRPKGDTGPTRLSRKSISNRMLVVQGVVRHALRKGWIGEDPLVQVERVGPPAPSPDFNVLEPEQVEAVARAVQTVRDDELPRMRNDEIDEHALAAMRRARAMWAEFIRVAAYTGLRLGELRALRWRDVDFSNETIRVTWNAPTSAPADAELRAPKSQKPRGVPMIDQAVTALDRVSKLGHPDAPDDLVFPTLGGLMQDGGRVRDAFYDGLQRAKLGHLRTGPRPIVFHDLRHTFGTLAVRVFPVSDVQALMGHAHITTTMRYVHHVPQADAARKLSSVFVSVQSHTPDKGEEVSSGYAE